MRDYQVIKYKMREIKFRAWDKESKEMVELTSNAFNELLLNDCFAKLQEDYELMQYTGLHDCHGKEIWEGDLVKVENEKTPRHIFFGDGMFQATSGWVKIYELNIEVIGNIYENPNLLTNPQGE